MWATLKQQVCAALQTELPDVVVWLEYDAALPDADTVIVRRVGTGNSRPLFAPQSGVENFFIECIATDRDTTVADLKLQSLENNVIAVLSKLARMSPINGIVINSTACDDDQFRPKVCSQFSVSISWRLFV